MFSSSRNKRWNGKRKLSDQQVPNKKPSNQQQQTKTADLFFDFSNDPKVINARKQLDTAREKIPSLPIQYDIVASSNGNVSLPGSSGSRERPVASMSDFKLASGEPITKETNDQTSLKSVKQLGNSRFLDNRQVDTNVNADVRRPIGPSAPFKPPWKNAASVSSTSTTSRGSIQTFNHGEQGESSSSELKSHPSLKHFDANLISLIEAEIMSVTQDTGWLDVAGLEGAKKALREIVVLPFKRPDVFKGIRSPPKGVLLFGPPGTGKTLIGKCVASQCAATFFNISASSLTSKWVGEGEKLVRALFAVARIRLPAVIFIDEIDSLLSSRNDAEHESSRRIKTEFLVQLDGLATASEERLLVLGATNRPHELDEAARRRFVKRLYIGLPEAAARISIVQSLLVDQLHSLTEEELNEIARLSEGYSGADMRQLCAEAAMIPVRELYDRIDNVTTEEIRSITLKDFEAALQVVRKTVVDTDLGAYEKFDEKFGCLV